MNATTQLMGRQAVISTDAGHHGGWLLEAVTSWWGDQTCKDDQTRETLQQHLAVMRGLQAHSSSGHLKSDEKVSRWCLELENKVRSRKPGLDAPPASSMGFKMTTPAIQPSRLSDELKSRFRKTTQQHPLAVKASKAFREEVVRYFKMVTTRMEQAKLVLVKLLLKWKVCDWICLRCGLLHRQRRIVWPMQRVASRRG